MTSDEQSVRELVATWMRASASGDLTRVLNLMSDDVIFLTPGREPFGRKEFEEGFLLMQQQVRLDAFSQVQEVNVCGNMAYVRVKLSIATTSLSTGRTSQRSGYGLSVLRKTSDGKWVIARDANLLI